MHAHADPGGDRQQDDRQQERQAPAPGFELVATDVAAAQHHQQRQQQPKGGSGLDKTGVEAPFAMGRMLGHIGGSTAVFTAQRQPLQHAQDHQDDRCGDADAGVGGQQPHREGGQAHQHDGDQEGVLAPDHVAQPAEHQRAERPHQEAGGKGHEGEDEGGGVVHASEELLADDRCQRTIEKKVIPLENRPEG
ncbi:hypothetical protein D3C76_1199960 [compost metagenome]